MNSPLHIPALHDRSHTGGAIRFIRHDGSTHTYYSWVNSMTGSRLSGFDSAAPSVDDPVAYVKSVFRDIRRRTTVLESIGDL